MPSSIVKLAHTTHFPLAWSHQDFSNQTEEKSSCRHAQPKNAEFRTCGANPHRQITSFSLLPPTQKPLFLAWWHINANWLILSSPTPCHSRGLSRVTNSQQHHKQSPTPSTTNRRNSTSSSNPPSSSSLSQVIASTKVPNCYTAPSKVSHATCSRDK